MDLPFAIPNPVRIGFDPTDGGIDDAAHEGGVSLRDIFADDLARTYWLAIKSTHLTNQHFRADCTNVARLCRAHLDGKGDLKSPDPRERLRAILSMGTQMFEMHRGVTDALLDELLPYMTGEKKLEFVIER